ncbi:MAG: hypothetical protein RL576_929 [Actinomycetota bacterium]
MSTLSEFASKEILARHGLPILQERVVVNSSEVGEVLDNMSLPVVAKLCGPSIAHKTERGLVKLNLQTVDDVYKAVDDLLAAAVPADGEVEVLIAPMVKSSREFIAGVVRDAQFGANVMLGVGGVLAEAIADVVFRPVPLSAHDAHEMVSELRSQKLLGEFRGEPAVSVDALVRVLLALSTVSTERSDIASIDLNPLLVTNTGEVVAVDALVEIEDAPTTTLLLLFLMMNISAHFLNPKVLLSPVLLVTQASLALFPFTTFWRVDTLGQYSGPIFHKRKYWEFKQLRVWMTYPKTQPISSSCARQVARTLRFFEHVLAEESKQPFSLRRVTAKQAMKVSDWNKNSLH